MPNKLESFVTVYVCVYHCLKQYTSLEALLKEKWSTQACICEKVCKKHESVLVHKSDLTLLISHKSFARGRVHANILKVGEYIHVLASWE